MRLQGRTTLCNVELSRAWGEKAVQFRPAVISRAASLCEGRGHIMTDPGDHTAPRYRAWGACMASGRDGPNGTANPASTYGAEDVRAASSREGRDGVANRPYNDTRDHRDYRRGYQSGHRHVQSARQPTSGAGEPASTRRSLRNRRNNTRSCEFYFPLIWGIYGRCAVFSFERKDF